MHKIRESIFQQKQEFEKTAQASYIKRTEKLQHLDTRMIKVIIGPRRAGKSYFVIHELKNLKTAYLNFDDEVLAGTEQYNEMLRYLKEISPDADILLVDEIQNLKKWELFVNRLQRQGYNIVLTGSNSNLLSSELATHLTGRYVSKIIFPFSFKEYLKGEEDKLAESEIKTKFSNYIKNGGFPEPYVTSIDYTSYLKTLFDSIVLKDLVIRFGLKKPKVIEALAKYLISNIGSPVSLNTLTKLTDIKSVHTIAKYLGYLEETFLFFKLDRYSFKLKEQIKSNKKIYVLDNGFIAAKSFSVSANIGRLYENAVAISLIKKQLNGEIEFYYFKDEHNYEADFIIKKGNKITEIIQVCYDLSDPKTKNREFRGLIHAGKALKCSNLLLLTDDQDEIEISEWYGEKYKIKYQSLWKWLLEN